MKSGNLKRSLSYLLRLVGNYMHKIIGTKPWSASYDDKLAKIWYNESYKHDFLKLNLIDAYRTRLKYAIKIHEGIHNGDSTEVKNYLSIMNEPDLYEDLHLPAKDLELLTKINEEPTDHLFLTSPKRTKISRVVLFGPGGDISKLDENSHDLYVFNKPPKEVNIQSHRIMLILNNQWTLNNQDSLRKWMQDHPETKIISPVSTDFGLSRDEVFDIIPRFPFKSSLMGLQRAMFILNHIYEIKCLEIVGYNFSLSEQPYQKWYPSMIEQNYGNFKLGLIHSNCRHDFMLNYLYTRKILDRLGVVSGEVKLLCKLSSAEIMSRFEKIYSK